MSKYSMHLITPGDSNGSHDWLKRLHFMGRQAIHYTALVELYSLWIWFGFDGYWVGFLYVVY